jgi:SAM-dependent methyltransferase
VLHKVIDGLRTLAPYAHGDMLDIGCGSRPFEDIVRGRVRSIVGTDLPDSRYTAGARVDVYARAEALPFRDGSFDTVQALSVLTYLREPGRLTREASRVLRPGGVLILEATQMAPLHDAPHDYFRFTRFGAEALLNDARLDMVACVPLGGLWARVGLSLIAALNRLNHGPLRVLTEIPVRLLYIVIQVTCELMDRLFFTRGEHLSHLCVGRKRGETNADATKV